LVTDMKILLALVLMAAPLAAADITATATVADEHLPAFRAFLIAAHPEADTDESGAVSNAEAAAWLRRKMVETSRTFTVRAVEWAEANAREILPTTHRERRLALETAQAELETERTRATATGNGR
jgi:hypothetical protein